MANAIAELADTTASEGAATLEPGVRPDARDIAAWLPGTDVDVRVCGPADFAGAVGAALAARGVAPERIASESF